MARQFSFHLLIVWLLLSQLSRGLPALRMDEVIKLCGRELAREWIATCGAVRRSQEETQMRSRSPAETKSSPINKDAETINMMPEFIPNLPQEMKATLSEGQPSLTELKQLSIPGLESLQVGFEEYKGMVQAQSEEKKTRLTELKDSGLGKHSQEKRLFSRSLSEECCQVGCIRKALARACSF